MNKLISTLAVLFVLAVGCFCFWSETEAQPQNLRKAGPFAFSGTASTITATGDIKTGGFYWMTGGEGVLFYQSSGDLYVAVGQSGPNAKYFAMDTNGVAMAPRGFSSGGRTTTPVAAEFLAGGNSLMLWASNNVVYVSVYNGSAVTSKQLLP